MTDETINGQIAEQENAVTILLEHRFYGQSTPFGNLEESSLKYHTIQQAIDDLEYFADNVVLPFPGGDSVKPTQAPWILIGGSYSGALTGWTMVKYVQIPRDNNARAYALQQTRPLPSWLRFVCCR